MILKEEEIPSNPNDVKR